MGLIRRHASRYSNRAAVKKALAAGVSSAVLVKRSAMSFVVAGDPEIADTSPKIKILSEKPASEDAAAARPGDTVTIAYVVVVVVVVVVVAVVVVSLSMCRVVVRTLRLVPTHARALFGGVRTSVFTSRYRAYE